MSGVLESVDGKKGQKGMSHLQTEDQNLCSHLQNINVWLFVCLFFFWIFLLHYYYSLFLKLGHTPVIIILLSYAIMATITTDFHFLTQLCFFIFV